MSRFMQGQGASILRLRLSPPSRRTALPYRGARVDGGREGSRDRAGGGGWDHETLRKGGHAANSQRGRGGNRRTLPPAASPQLLVKCWRHDSVPLLLSRPLSLGWRGKHVLVRQKDRAEHTPAPRLGGHTLGHPPWVCSIICGPPWFVRMFDEARGMSVAYDFSRETSEAGQCIAGCLRSRRKAAQFSVFRRSCNICFGGCCSGTRRTD